MMMIHHDDDDDDSCHDHDHGGGGGGGGYDDVPGSSFFVFHALCIYHHTFPTLAAQDIQVEACRVADERPWAGHPKVSNIIIYRLEIFRCRHLLPLPAPYLFLEIRGLWV